MILQFSCHVGRNAQSVSKFKVDSIILETIQQAQLCKGKCTFVGTYKVPIHRNTLL